MGRGVPARGASGGPRRPDLKGRGRSGENLRRTTGARGFELTFQVFVSYARNDDKPFPPDSSVANGFVATLEEYLYYEFDKLGRPPEIAIWRDKRAIEPTSQFDPEIRDGIAKSEVFVAILSRTWLARPWCRTELELFAERWRSEGEAGIKARIVVVPIHAIPRDQLPPLLQGQEGIPFYRRERNLEAGKERLHFHRGAPAEEFHEQAERLASDLWRRAYAKRFDAPPAPPPKAAEKAASAPARDDARTIYLAKPARDMAKAYARLVDELQKRGYRIAPPPESDIDLDAEGERAPEIAIAKALAESEASIHVLGELPGRAGDYEGAEPLVKLQLRLAAQAAEERTGASGGARFRRNVWAPAVLEQIGDAPEHDAAQPEVPVRDAYAVLERFGTACPTDAVVDSNMAKFVDYLIDHLNKNAPAVERPQPLGAKAKVYVYHRQDDAPYALDIAAALEQEQIEAITPVLDGEPAELREYHRKYLQECDAVVLCWANTSESWTIRTAEEFDDWQALGRTTRFACRGVVAGPPPHVQKVVRKTRLPKQIDVIVDLTDGSEPTPQALEPLIQRATS